MSHHDMPMKAQRGGRDLTTSHSQTQHLARPLYPREITGNPWKRGWACLEADLERHRKSRPTRNRSADRSGRRDSLYRLGHPGRHFQSNIYIYIYISCVWLWIVLYLLLISLLNATPRNIRFGSKQTCMHAMFDITTDVWNCMNWRLWDSA